MAKIQKLVEAKGFCCPFWYFLSTNKREVNDIAEELGIAPRTVRWYRNQIQKKNCICAKRCSKVVKKII